MNGSPAGDIYAGAVYYTGVGSIEQDTKTEQNSGVSDQMTTTLTTGEDNAWLIMGAQACCVLIDIVSGGNERNTDRQPAFFDSGAVSPAASHSIVIEDATSGNKRQKASIMVELYPTSDAVVEAPRTPLIICQ